MKKEEDEMGVSFSVRKEEEEEAEAEEEGVRARCEDGVVEREGRWDGDGDGG